MEDFEKLSQNIHWWMYVILINATLYSFSFEFEFILENTNFWEQFQFISFAIARRKNKSSQ